MALGDYMEIHPGEIVLREFHWQFRRPYWSQDWRSCPIFINWFLPTWCRFHLLNFSKIHLENSGASWWVLKKQILHFHWPISIAQRTKHLKVQLDNTAKENKNHTVLYFFGYIVSRLKWFLTVQINFLLVGHTHKDIDQWHSLAHEMFRYNRNTLHEMIGVYLKVYIESLIL